MPAQVVGLNDELDNPGEGNPLEGLTVTPAQPAPAPAPMVLDGEDIPEKYRGKTPRELLDIVTNQESMIGRQGHELGELRQAVGTLRGTVDAALALRDPGNGREEVGTEDDLSERDFALDPVDATRRTVRKETAELNSELSKLKGEARALKFTRDHPSAEKDINDPAFIEFVKRSPTRLRLATEAFGDPRNINYNSAEELWELYEDFQSLAPSGAGAEATQAAESAPAAEAPAPKPADRKQPPQMVTGHGGAEAGKDSKSGKPVYSQSLLNELAEKNPDKYWSEAVQRPLREAYAEGRVIQDI